MFEIRVGENAKNVSPVKYFFELDCFSQFGTALNAACMHMHELIPVAGAYEQSIQIQQNQRQFHRKGDELQNHSIIKYIFLGYDDWRM